MAAIFGFPDHPAYAAGNGGIDQLTKTRPSILSTMYRVNAVPPSWIGTDLVGKAIDDKTQKRIKERMPQGRFGKP